MVRNKQGCPPVIVVGGTSSGVGKTSLSVGLMAAFRKRGMVVQSFKVGPDFLDPLHHEAVTGRQCINLDGWMLTREQNLAAFWRGAEGADICIVEGVMGLFDGRDGRTEAGSTAEMAKWLGAPVVLVLDCWAIARSAGAVIKGFLGFDTDLRLAGIIFNKVGGAAHTEWLREAIESSGVDTRIFGGIMKDDSVTVPERHLGLHLPEDGDVPKDYSTRLGALMEEGLDLELLLAEARAAAVPPLPPPAPVPPLSAAAQRVRIGVARDAAFNFYYWENLTLLEAAGAELVPFSPISGVLPDSVSALYFGGGYPERHAQALAANTRLMAAVRAFASAGGVVYAECGGLIYLSQSIEAEGEAPCSMVGIFPFRTNMAKKGMKMGYVEVETRDTCPLFPPGLTARGHVFHFSQILEEKIVGGFGPLASPTGYKMCYSATMQAPGAQPVAEGYTCNNVLASYVHLHFGSCPQLAQALVAAAQRVNVSAVNAAALEAASTAAFLQLPPLRRGTHSPEAVAPDSSAFAPTSACVMPPAYAQHRQPPSPDAAPLQNEPARLRSLPNPGDLLRSAGVGTALCSAASMGAQEPSCDNPREAGREAGPGVSRVFWADSRGEPVRGSGPWGPGVGSAGIPQPYRNASSCTTSPETDPQARARAMGAVLSTPNLAGLLSWPPHVGGHHGYHQAPEHRGSRAMSTDQWTEAGGAVRDGRERALMPPPKANSFDVGNGKHYLQGRPPSPSTTLLRALSSADPLSSSVETSPPPSPPQPSAFRSAQYEDGSGYLHPQHSQPLTPELPSCLQPWDRPPYAVHPHWEDAARKSLHERDWPGGTCSTNGTAGFLPWEDSVLRHQSSGRVMDAVTFWDLGPGQFAVRGGTERERERSLRSWDGTRGNPGAPVAGPGPAPGWRSPRESIVSLLPSGTEILFALGLGNRVAGVTDLCDYPKEAATRTKVSHSRFDLAGLSSAEVEARCAAAREKGEGGWLLDVEWLAREQPGLVLTQDSCRLCDADAFTVAEALQRAGLLGPHSATRVLTLTPRTLSDVMDSILEVGAAAGVGPEAHCLVDRLRTRLRAVACQVAGAKRRPRVLSLESVNPLVLGGQWLPEMKQLAGGCDDWQEPGDPPLRITWDEVKAYAPEVLILAPCSAGIGRGLSEACSLAAMPGWWGLPAVKSGRVYVVDHAYFSRPGPRLVEGVEMLARILHPDLVTKRCLDKTVLKLSLHSNQRCRQKLLANYFLPYA